MVIKHSLTVAGFHAEDPLPDPDDEAFAQLALEAKVGYLVTCNLRDYPPDRLPALQVVSPKEFLQVLRKSKP